MSEVEINNKWVVHEKRDDVYFTGMGSGDYPVFEHLNSRVRTYKSERSAKMAINRIGEREYCEFEAVYIAREEVPNVPEDKPSDKGENTAPVLAEVKEPDGWGTVYACAKPPTLDDEIARRPVKFAQIALCRTVIAGREIFGVIAADGKLYSAGFGGGETALRFFLEEYYKYLLPRVTRGGD